jgi:hypothetical protein
MSGEEQLTLLADRRDRIREWLQEEAAHMGSEQKHLDPDTPESAYWHHGYQAALDDMIELLSS